jgi:predicted permease
VAWILSVLADLRYGIRSLATAPSFSLTALLSLAVGLAAAATSVSVIDSLGLRPLAAADPSSLVRVSLAVGHERSDRAAAADIAAMQAGAPALSAVAGESMRGAALNDSAGPPVVAMLDVVTGNYFELLGVPPAAGRALSVSDDEITAAPVMMLSERLWRRRYGSDRAVVGRAVDLDGSAVTVVGIVPASFGGLNQMVAPDLWLPRNTWRGIQRISDQSWNISATRDRDFTVIGRLALGSTLSTVQSQLDAVVASLARGLPDLRRDARLGAEMDRAARERPALNLRTLAAALIGLVVVVGCANVTGLLLGRSEMRRRDLAIRAALGASRARLVRQLLAESVVLAMGGAVVGLTGGWWLIHTAPSLLPPTDVPLALDFRFDSHVMIVTAVAALGTVVIFGVFPAFAATRPNLIDPIKLDRSGELLGGRFAFRRLLVAGQVGVATALVVMSGLLLRSLWNTERIPLGFAEKPALLVTIAPSVVPSYVGGAAQQFVRDFADAVKSLPGVTDVTRARRIPLAPNGGGAAREVDLPGARDADGHLPQIHFNAVAPNYFHVMGTRIVDGPGFPARLGPSDQKLVVINEAMAQEYWPNGGAIGQSLRVTGAGSFEIVGVVETGKYLDISESPDPYMFFSLDQVPSGETTVLATAPRPGEIAPAVRATLARLDSRMPVLSLLTLDEHLNFARYQAKTLAGAAAAIGSAGLALGLIGLYAVISFVVSRQRRDLGIRMALGAEPRDVILNVLKQAALVVGAGLTLGLVLAPAMASPLANSLVGTSPFDPTTYVAAVLAVAIASLLAVWEPSRRASRIDPAITLRE